MEEFFRNLRTWFFQDCQSVSSWQVCFVLFSKPNRSKLERCLFFWCFLCGSLHGPLRVWSELQNDKRRAQNRVSNRLVFVGVQKIFETFSEGVVRNNNWKDCISYIERYKCIWVHHQLWKWLVCWCHTDYDYCVLVLCEDRSCHFYRFCYDVHYSTCTM